MIRLDGFRRDGVGQGDVAQGYLEAGLPAVGFAGRLARVTDSYRGLVMEDGARWNSVGREWFNVRRFGATGDGITDDQASIQDTYEAIPATGGDVWFPPGTYLADTLLAQQDYTRTYMAAGAKILARTSEVRILNSNDFDHVEYIGCHVVGTGKDTGSSSGRGGIHLSNLSEFCIVRDSTIEAASGSGIVDDGQRNKVVHNTILETGEHGIYLSSAQEGTCEGNYIRDAGKNSVLSPPLSGIKIDGCENQGIQNNTIIDAQTQGLTITGPTQFSDITHNKIKGSGENDIYIATGNDCDISHNIVRSDATGFDSILTVGGTRNTISFNRVKRDQAGGSAIRWNTVGALGKDIVVGNKLFTSIAHPQPAIHIDNQEADDVLIALNYIDANYGTGINIGANVERTVCMANKNRATVRYVDAGTETMILDTTDFAMEIKRGGFERISTASLPAAAVANDGRLVIEDNGAGDRNLILYAGGQRFRIDGGVPF